MHRVISAELSRRSFYLSVGPLEAYGEWRSADWPKLWSRAREPGSYELWLGRAYLCVSRARQETSEPSPAPPQPAPNGEPNECRILAFKAPIRAA